MKKGKEAITEISKECAMGTVTSFVLSTVRMGVTSLTSCYHILGRQLHLESSEFQFFLKVASLVLFGRDLDNYLNFSVI